MMFSTVFWRYILFVSLFIGTGFIAGSIVHFGEGVTVWDVTVLCIGIVLFTTSSVIQEYMIEKKPYSVRLCLRYLLLSLTLAISIGMASGGFQHFIDTPEYSAILIPIGLSLGILTFIVRQRYSMSIYKWIILICSAAIFAFFLWYVLLVFNSLLPESLRHGHGSHSITVEESAVQPSSSSGSLPNLKDHDH